MEIEKKYLVDKAKLPEILRNKDNTVRINQYYLNDINDTWLIRTRSFETTFPHPGMFNAYYLTLKTLGLEAREELEYNITKEEFDKTVQQAKTKLKKQRHHVVFNGIPFEFEIDEYDDYDFVTCEIEFDTEEEYLAFEVIKPNWCFQDVTKDKKYKNVNLAK
jgi:CYTH domain-containing protein